MPNYNEQTITGSKWTRCNRVAIDNPSSGEKKITFFEETAMNVDGSVETFGKNVLELLYQTDVLIPIIDPVTLAPTGEHVTIPEIEKYVFSAYMEAANRRDENRGPIYDPEQFVNPDITGSGQ